MRCLRNHKAKERPELVWALKGRCAPLSRSLSAGVCRQVKICCDLLGGAHARLIAGYSSARVLTIDDSTGSFPFMPVKGQTLYEIQSGASTIFGGYAQVCPAAAGPVCVQ